MQPIFIIHYHEIGLKGKNRAYFERKLIENLKRSLVSLGDFNVRRISGRILIIPKTEFNLAEVEEKINKVFGIAYYSPAFISEVSLDLGEKIIEPLSQEILALIKKRKFNTFQVEAKRSNKEFILKSPEIEKQLGGFLFKNLKTKKVDLENPDLTVYVEIVEKYLFWTLEKIKGQGGLPSGVGGRVVCLLSSGFDSPVAAYQIAKRGVKVDFLHFHSYPQTTKASQENVKKLVSVLNEYQYDGRLYFSAFGDFQKKIVAGCPAKLRVILYRRMMLRVAEKLAFKLRAKALVTGDSLGQVASQTLENILAISEAVTLPILRPLIGEDKQDIINLADKINTYQISSQPYEDCCSMFIPQNPETKAKLEEVKKAEAGMEIEKLAEEIFRKIEEVERRDS